jgi:hypothetical protein
MRPTELVTRFIYTRSAEQVTRSICMRQLLLRTRPVQMCKKRTVRAARIVGTARVARVARTVRNCTCLGCKRMVGLVSAAPMSGCVECKWMVG